MSTEKYFERGLAKERYCQIDGQMSYRRDERRTESDDPRGTGNFRGFFELAGAARETDPPETDPRSPRPFVSALVATALIVAGALFSTAALILIATIVSLGIDAARGVAVGPLSKQISWADVRTGVSHRHLRRDIPRHRHRQAARLRLDRAGAALLGASLMVATGVLASTRPIAPSTSTRSRCCSA